MHMMTEVHSLSFHDPHSRQGNTLSQASSACNEIVINFYEGVASPHVITFNIISQKEKLHPKWLSIYIALKVINTTASAAHRPNHFEPHEYTQYRISKTYIKEKSSSFLPSSRD